MTAGIKSVFRKIWDVTSDVVWPKVCICCNRDDHLDNGTEVCDICWGSLLKARGLPSPRGIDRLWIGFQYDERMRTIIHRFKFQKGIYLAKQLAYKLSERLTEMEFVAGDSVVIPVPDHPSRRRERGFNPAEILAKYLAEIQSVPFSSSLSSRILAGPHQSLLTVDDRKTTMKGAFSIEKCDDSSKILVIVDDVVKTGTTVSRLAFTARKSGWKSIEAVCLCQS